jgi:isopenicillin N synthase-like dioxygenase
VTSEGFDVAVVDYLATDAPKEFTRSLRDTGFAVVVNHPLPWDLVEEIYAEWSAFFDSPEVLNYVVDPSAQEGYFPPNMSETAKGGAVRDLKEFFHVYPWSVFPSEVSGAALRYAEIAADMARTLLGWVEANTPAEIAARFSQPLASMIDGSRRTLLRVLRYPPLDGGEAQGAVRAAAHEDINLLTVLPAADEPGLQLLDATGRWHEVPCDPGSVAVNGGEMLDLASGGYYPATTHRVVNPTGDAARRPRMSLPLFLHPADDVVLANGRTASSFLAERIRELRGADGR